MYVEGTAELLQELPDVTIFTKLEALRPGARATILASFETLAQQRRDDVARYEENNQPHSVREFLTAIFHPHATPRANVHSVHGSVLNVADNMREAILTYMHDNKITARDAGLNAAEIDHLHYKELPHPAYQRFAPGSP